MSVTKSPYDDLLETVKSLMGDQKEVEELDNNNHSMVVNGKLYWSLGEGFGFMVIEPETSLIHFLKDPSEEPNVGNQLSENPMHLFLMSNANRQIIVFQLGVALHTTGKALLTFIEKM